MSRKSNILYARRKSRTNHAIAVVTSSTGTNAKEVTLEGKARAMTTVADVAETIRRKSMQELDVRKITIGTEETPQQENGTRNVSTIKTTLKRE